MPEHGTVHNKMAETFVDNACQYMKAAADPTKEANWESMKRELDLSPLLRLLPADVQSRLREAEMKDEQTRRRMERLPKPSKESDLINIKLFFVGEDPKHQIGEDYTVKRKTPPLALAAAVILSKRAGYSPHFYTDKPHPIDKSPADWSVNKSPPETLYVVIDRGRFDFQLEMRLQPPISGNGVFRNIFKLQAATGVVYLKDFEGNLHSAPAGDLKFERPVQCMSFQRTDQKRIAGPLYCTQWSEALDHLLNANNDDWIIKPEDIAAQRQPASSSPASVRRAPPSAYPHVRTERPFMGSTTTIHGSSNTRTHSNTSITTPVSNPTSAYRPPPTHRTASTLSNATLFSSPITSIPASAFTSTTSIPRTALTSTTTTTPSTSTPTLSSHQADHPPKSKYTPTPAPPANLPHIPIAFGFSPIYKRDGFIKRAANWTKKKLSGEYA